MQPAAHVAGRDALCDLARARIGDEPFTDLEFMHDEAIALYDFSRAFPVEIEFFAQTDTTIFKQVFGRMRRAAFEPKA